MNTYNGNALMNKFKALLLTFLFFVLSQAATAEDYVIYYHNDALGSPVAATNEQGTVLWKEQHLAYGEKVINDQSASNEKIGYTGKAFDKETGLNYYGARYYDPVVGRFMGIDPVGFQQANIHSFNRYAYANNNPIKYNDPDGRYADLAIEVVSISLGAASLGNNLYEGNYGSAAIDAGGIVADVLLGIVPIIPGGVGIGIKASRQADELAAVAKSTVGELRAAGKKDAHHIIQDAAAKNIPGYKTNKAPGIQLEGPASTVGTAHHTATQVQRQAGGGTYAAERRIGYKALRKAGVSRQDARQHIQNADDYFGGLGVTGSTSMRTVGNRKGGG